MRSCNIGIIVFVASSVPIQLTAVDGGAALCGTLTTEHDLGNSEGTTSNTTTPDEASHEIYSHVIDTHNKGSACLVLLRSQYLLVYIYETPDMYRSADESWLSCAFGVSPVLLRPPGPLRSIRNLPHWLVLAHPGGHQVGMRVTRLFGGRAPSHRGRTVDGSVVYRQNLHPGRKDIPS